MSHFRATTLEVEPCMLFEEEGKNYGVRIHMSTVTQLTASLTTITIKYRTKWGTPLLQF